MKFKFCLLLIRIILKICGVEFDWWDESMVSGFPDFFGGCQYNMVQGSGSSSSNPRWNLDLNLHPLEDVEVPAEEAPEVEVDVYGERDQTRIACILDAQLQGKISDKKNEIREVLEKMVQEEIEKRKLSCSDFDFRKLDQLVNQVIREHAHQFPSNNLKKKLRSYSYLKTVLSNDMSGINYQVKTYIERNLLDFIIQE